MPDDKGHVSEQEKADLAKRRGQAAAKIADPQERQKFIADQGNAESKGDLPVTTYQRLSDEAALKGYKHGTDRVPKTGPAVLHEDEAVLKKEDADKYRDAKEKHGKDIFDLAGAGMGAGKHKPKKEIKSIHTRKAKSGGYIHEHHHTHPDVHPMEEHTSPDDEAMAQHMIASMGANGGGDPNAGDSGAGDAGAAAMTA